MNSIFITQQEPIMTAVQASRVTHRSDMSIPGITPAGKTPSLDELDGSKYRKTAEEWIAAMRAYMDSKAPFDGNDGFKRLMSYASERIHPNE